MNFLINPAIVKALIIMAFSYLGLIWLSLVIWTISDSIRRSQSFVFQLFSTLLVMIFNILGLILYFVLRPAQTIQEAHDENLEREYILKQTMGDRCPKCKSIVKTDYKICPFCSYQLKSECHACHKLISPSFRLCPYCGVTQKDSQSEKQSSASS